VIPPGWKPASKKSSWVGQAGWNLTMRRSITPVESLGWLNTPVAVAPCWSLMLIVLRLTVLKSTPWLNRMSIGRLIFHVAPSVTEMCSTLKSAEEAVLEPLPPQAAATSPAIQAAAQPIEFGGS